MRRFLRKLKSMNGIVYAGEIELSKMETSKKVQKIKFKKKNVMIYEGFNPSMSNMIFHNKIFVHILTKR